MRRALATFALLAGCDRVWGLERSLDAFEQADARTCFGKFGENNLGLLEVCLDDVTIPDEYDVPASIDTDDPPAPACTKLIAQSDAPPTMVCVIAAKNMVVQRAVELHGDRPVVLIATETLIVRASGSLDASSRRGGLHGAGADTATCPAPKDGIGQTTAGSGGAGGAFGGAGARGGDTMAGTPGGAQPPAIGLGAIRGGCPGGRGGNGAMAVAGGGGGIPGGAVYLIAGERIEITGSINASGMSGAGGARSPSAGGAGGGGGGSGGFIGLDAPHVELAANSALVANGGGGGGGGGGQLAMSTAGINGLEPVVIGGTSPFKGNGGGGGAANGGSGGGGSAGTNVPLTGSSGVGGGGGGGGGGAGQIVIYATKVENLGAHVTPPSGP